MEQAARLGQDMESHTRREVRERLRVREVRERLRV
jgi:hypothetical protein